MSYEGMQSSLDWAPTASSLSRLPQKNRRPQQAMRVLPKMSQGTERESILYKLCRFPDPPWRGCLTRRPGGPNLAEAPFRAGVSSTRGFMAGVVVRKNARPVWPGSGGFRQVSEVVNP